MHVVEILKEYVWDLLGCEGVHEGELVRLFTDGLELGVVEALREPVTVSCAEGGVGVMLPLPLREVVG